MTELREVLTRRIAAEGPMTIAEYMAMCLTHPRLGYYATRDPFGTAGDFVTAPEISQMFGEVIGLCLAQSWIDIGQPPGIALAELGPGRGTLMADVLRATRTLPGFHDAVDLYLVESSPHLRGIQAETLAGYDPNWVPTTEAIPDAPLFLVANEFFDALPIRQFIRTEAGWSERMVGLDGEDRLAFGLSRPAPLAALDDQVPGTRPGDMVQLCSAASNLAQGIGAHIAAHGGLALVIDYGDWEVRGDTFQAVRAHRKCDPLAAPGQSDLTAHVAFGEIARALPDGVGARPLIGQGAFLERLGIARRADIIARSISGPALRSHLAAHRRLTHPDEMGSLFKVLAIAPQTAPLPPGFDP